jgi:2,4-dichlorophenol 6-monooxygenase
LAGAFGVLPGAPVEHNRRSLEALFSDTEDGRRRFARLQEVFRTLRLEYGAADIELGFQYDHSPAVVPDGSHAPPSDPYGHQHVQTARPGHRLPHAWLDRFGQTVGTHDLLRVGAFLLLAGADGDAWCDAGDALQRELGLPIEPHCVGAPHALRDRDDVWHAVRGHGPDGAILVRPDGHVAYRCSHRPDDPRAALESALLVALGRSATRTLSAAVAHGAG